MGRILFFPESYRRERDRTDFANDNERHLEARVEYIKEKAKGRVLDLACDDGYLSEYFREYVGIDITTEAIKWANANKRGFFVNGIMEILPFRNASFDAAILGEALEHSVYPLEILRECNRVLRSFGTLLITTPIPIWHEKIGLLENKDHVHEFHPTELYNLCSLAGFFVLEYKAVETYKGRLTSLVYAKKLGLQVYKNVPTFVGLKDGQKEFANINVEEK